MDRHQLTNLTLSTHLGTDEKLAYCVCVSFFLSFFSFFFSREFLWLLAFPVGLVHCSRDLQTSFFNKIFIKNGFHDTIHIFKNYFASVFSVFSFQQNKRYPNISLVCRIVQETFLESKFSGP